MRARAAQNKELNSAIRHIKHSIRVMHCLVMFAGSSALLETGYGQPSSGPDTKFWRPDGPVRAITVKGDKVYLGGQFRYVGPFTGGAALIDPASGAVKQGFPFVQGSVSAATPDGAGGWYIAGAFWSVEGVLRSNVAHVLADNSVDRNWNPNANNSCLAIVRVANTIYVGGNFTRIGGQARNRLAALDATTGQLTTWNPNPNSSVSALLVSGSTLYLGGVFTSLGGQNRSHLAAVDLSTGSVSPWNPGANNTVNVLAVSGTTVYVGGIFTTAGGKPRNRIAALDTSSNTALDWNPNANNTVDALAVGNGVVYAGGQFTTIGGQNRTYVVELDAGTGQATLWNPSLDKSVSTLLLRGNQLFVGGSFTSANGQAQAALARFDLTTGQLSEWDPRVSSLLQTTAPQSGVLVSDDDQLLVAGAFVSIGGVLRSNLAALDRSTGQVTDWNPNANGLVTALAADESQVYVGGTFTSVGGSTRQRLAAVDLLSGAPTGWTANVLGRSTVGIFALAPDSANRLYVGGNFTNVSGQTRNSLAALDRSTAEVLPWNPNAVSAYVNNSATVNALLVTTNTIYVGGDFVNVGTKARNRIAALHPLNGVATDWNPNANGTVSALSLYRTNIFAGGLFTTIGGQPRNRLACLDPGTGVPTSWNPNTEGTSAQVWSIVGAGCAAYVGGEFAQSGGEFRNHAAGISVDTGRAHSWDPSMDNQVRVLYWTPEEIYVGGDFTKVSNRAVAYFAGFNAAPTFLPETIQRQENGTFLATLQTGEGTRIIVQTSKDWQSWQDLATNSVTGFPLNFVHSSDGSSPRLFYRAVLRQD